MVRRRSSSAPGRLVGLYDHRAVCSAGRLPLLSVKAGLRSRIVAALDPVPKLRSFLRRCIRRRSEAEPRCSPRAKPPAGRMRAHGLGARRPPSAVRTRYEPLWVPALGSEPTVERFPLLHAIIRRWTASGPHVRQSEWPRDVQRDGVRRRPEIGIIAGLGRRRCWSASEKIRIVRGHLSRRGKRRRGRAPPWRRSESSVPLATLMLERGANAASRDDSASANRAVRRLEDRVRERERRLGRKTLEVEILKQAVVKSRTKKPTVHALSLKRNDGL